MKRRVNITIEEVPLKWAKAYAKRRYTNFSRLVAEYIIRLMEQEKKRRAK